MKALWQGYIALGQLGIPIRLYSATRSTAPDFRLLHQSDGAPVERIMKCSHDGHEIPYDEIVRAVRTTEGSYVTLTKQELERAGTRQAKVITLTQFADTQAIPALHYEKPYYITPGKGGERAYALLRDVLNETDKLAVGQFLMRDKEHIAAIVPHHDMLMLHRLRFVAELVPRSQIKTRALPKPTPTERAALRAVVERFTSQLFLEDFHDEYTEALHELVEHKSKGLPVPRRKPKEAHATPEGDIIPTLQNTLQQPIGIQESDSATAEQA